MTTVASPDSTDARTHVRLSAGSVLSRYGVIIAMIATFIVFSLLRPDSFFTLFMMKAILRDCAPLLIVSLGITFVLAMNDYDLSVGGLVALCATSAVLLVSSSYADFGPWLGVATALLLGLTLGAFSGGLIAYAGLPSFILTIAMGTIFTGVGLQLTGSASIYEGIPESYVAIAGGRIFGISNQVYIAIGVFIIAHVFLRHTEPGRYMYAIGGNPEAARLSGVPVRLLKALGYAILGLLAALTGVLLTSQAGAANPNTGVGLLLPAYAAVFLGSSMFRLGSFTAVGTALGALFLQIIGSGLTVLNLSGSLVQIIQGAILAVAILLARVNRKAG
jgi:ribose transport system permease protein